jgi:hypothetical protein
MPPPQWDIYDTMPKKPVCDECCFDCIRIIRPAGASSSACVWRKFCVMLEILQLIRKKFATLTILHFGGNLSTKNNVFQPIFRAKKSPLLSGFI